LKAKRKYRSRKTKPLTPNFKQLYQLCWEKARKSNLQGWKLVDYIIKCAKEAEKIE